MGAYDFELLRADALSALESQWNALWERADRRSVFTSYAWAVASLNHPPAHRPRRTFYCVAGHHHKALVLLWPFIVFRHRLWRMAIPLASERGQYSDVLIEYDDQVLMSQAWRFARTMIPADLFDFSSVRQSSPLRLTLDQYTDKLVLREGYCAIVKPTECVRLRGKDQSQQRGRLRRLQEVGSLEILCTFDVKKAITWTNWIIDHKMDWVRRRQLTQQTYVLNEDFRRFVIEIICELCPVQRCEVSVLALNGQLIAGDISFVSERWAEGFISTYDHEFGKYGPGNLLKFHVIKGLVNEIRGFDMLTDNIDSKRKFATSVETIAHYRCMSTLWGQFYKALGLNRGQQRQRVLLDGGVCR